MSIFPIWKQIFCFALSLPVPIGSCIVVSDTISEQYSGILSEICTPPYSLEYTKEGGS